MHSHSEGKLKALPWRDMVRLTAGLGLWLGAIFLPLDGRTRLLLFLAAYFTAGINVLRSVAGNLRRGEIFDEFFLMAIATGGAFAIGDCNGQNLLSHAAMHQGMLALMHSLSPFSLPVLKRERYVVPWSVFTEPEIAQVGLTEKEARAKGLDIQVIRKEFRSYGRTVADGHPEGFIKIITDKRGKIHGATIVGEAASELIHEWTMAIQYKKRMHHIMMMQHSFPSVSMINKMIAEDWMMEKMKSGWMQKLVKLLK